MMDDLDEFLQTSNLRLEAILDRIQWTKEDVLQDFNTNSIGSPKRTETEDMEYAMKRYVEPMLPPTCTGSNSVILAEKDLQQLLKDPMAKAPQRFSDLQVNFSREQKLLLYEYTVKQRGEVQPITTSKDELVSLADIVAMKKREKTKRRKYRISKPTQTEEVRSLVELQMQALQQYLETNHKIESDRENSKRDIKSKDYRKYSGYNEKQIAEHEDYRYHEHFREKSSTHEKCNKRSHERDIEDAQKHKISESKASRHSEFFETRSRCDANREKHKSRRRSRSRYTRKKSQIRSPSRHESRHHSKKRKKEKRKKSQKSSRQ